VGEAMESKFIKVKGYNGHEVIIESKTSSTYMLEKFMTLLKRADDKEYFELIKNELLSKDFRLVHAFNYYFRKQTQENLEDVCQTIIDTYLLPLNIYKPELNLYKEIGVNEYK